MSPTLERSNVSLAGLKTQLLDRFVVLVDVSASCLASNQLGEREQSESHVEVGASGRQQRAELMLGRLQRRVGHVVHEPDDERVAPTPNRRVCDTSRRIERGGHCAETCDTDDRVRSVVPG